MNISRRTLVSGLAGLATIALAACAGDDAATPAGAPGTSGGGAGDDAASSDSAWPVTVEHIYGTTTIERKPERVATVSWVNADVVLALGVVPVGMDTDTWGMNANNSTDWKDARLEELGAGWDTDAAPAQFDVASGIDFEGIASVTPDLIIGAYSGMTEEEYQRLSEIAPVIGPGVAAYQTPWQQSTEMIGAALGLSAEAAAMVAETEEAVREAGVGAHPDFGRVTAIAGNLDPAQNVISIYGLGDNRSRFLEMAGIPVAEFVGANGGSDNFYFEWSTERADELVSDLFFTWLPEGTDAGAIAAHPLFGQIPAVRGGGLVVLGSDAEVLAISAASPLSLPWVLDKVMPAFADATARVLAS